MLGQVVFWMALFALAVYLGVKAVRHAKRGVPGAQVLGAVSYCLASVTCAIRPTTSSSRRSSSSNAKMMIPATLRSTGATTHESAEQGAWQALGGFLA